MIPGFESEQYVHHTTPGSRTFAIWLRLAKDAPCVLMDTSVHAGQKQWRITTTTPKSRRLTAMDSTPKFSSVSAVPQKTQQTSSSSTPHAREMLRKRSTESCSSCSGSNAWSSTMVHTLIRWWGVMMKDEWNVRPATSAFFSMASCARSKVVLMPTRKRSIMSGADEVLTVKTDTSSGTSMLIFIYFNSTFQFSRNLMIFQPRTLRGARGAGRARRSTRRRRRWRSARTRR